MLPLTLFYIIGIGCVLLSVYLQYWRNRRKFNRRMGGIEIFDSYRQSLFTHYLENLVQFIYIFLRVIGIILLLAAYFDADDIKKITHW